MNVLLSFFFPVFFVRLALAATPSLLWLSALSFKNWRVVVAICFVFLGLGSLSNALFFRSNPFISELSAEVKLNRQLNAYSPTLVSFKSTQPPLDAWLALSKEFPTHRDILLQASLAAYYAQEYDLATTLWLKAQKSDPLYPLFETLPELAPLHE